MAAISGQPAPKPQSLDKPVPGASSQDDVQAFIDSYTAPKTGAAQVAAEPSSQQIDPESAQFIDSYTSDVANAPSVPDEMPWERMQRIGDPLQASKEIVGDQIARFRAAWSVSDDEKEGLLKKIYGDKGVRKGSDGSFQIRRPGEKGFRDFDPEGSFKNLDIIGDILDNSRNIFEGGIELGGRVGGGMMGAAEAAPSGMLAGAPAGPMGSAAGGVTTGMLGAIAGQSLGGAASSVAGLKAADWVAENVMGIERDPKRDGAKEAAIAAGIGGGAGAIFGAASGYMTRLRIARELRASSVTSQDVLTTAREVEKAAQALEAQGIKMRDGRMVLSPGQVAGDLAPEAKILDKELSTEGPVRDFFVNQGKLVTQAWDTLKQGMVNMTGKPANELFDSVKSAAKATREMEGKTIGTFRDDALKASKGAPREMISTSKALNPFLQTFGFDQVGGRLRAPTIDQLKQQFPDANEAVLGRVKSLATDLENVMYKNGGKIPLKEVDRIYTGFRDTIDSFIDTQSGRKVAYKMIGMKDAIRDDWARAIGSELQDTMPNALPAYKASMEKYSNILSAQESLKRLLKRDEMSAAAMAQEIFSPSTGKEKVKSMKTLLQATDENMWDDLVGHHLDRLQQDSINPKTGRIDWMKLDGKIKALEKSEILPEMLGDQERTNLKNFLSVAKRVDSSFNFKPGAAQSHTFLGAVRNMLILTVSQVSAVAKLTSGKNMAQGVIDNLGKDQAVKKWLQGEGLELVLKGMPKKEQSKIRRVITPMLEGGVATGMAAERRDQAVQRGMNYETNTEEAQ